MVQNSNIKMYTVSSLLPTHFYLASCETFIQNKYYVFTSPHFQPSIFTHVLFYTCCCAPGYFHLNVTHVGDL